MGNPECGIVWPQGVSRQEATCCCGQGYYKDEDDGKGEFVWGADIRAGAPTKEEYRDQRRGRSSTRSRAAARRSRSRNVRAACNPPAPWRELANTTLQRQRSQQASTASSRECQNVREPAQVRVEQEPQIAYQIQRQGQGQGPQAATRPGQPGAGYEARLLDDRTRQRDSPEQGYDSDEIEVGRSARPSQSRSSQASILRRYSDAYSPENQVQHPYPIPRSTRQSNVQRTTVQARAFQRSDRRIRQEPDEEESGSDDARSDRQQVASRTFPAQNSAFSTAALSQSLPTVQSRQPGPSYYGSAVRIEPSSTSSSQYRSSNSAYTTSATSASGHLGYTIVMPAPQRQSTHPPRRPSQSTSTNSDSTYTSRSQPQPQHRSVQVSNPSSRRYRLARENDSESD